MWHTRQLAVLCVQCLPRTLEELVLAENTEGLPGKGIQKYRRVGIALLSLQRIRNCTVKKLLGYKLQQWLLNP